MSNVSLTTSVPVTPIETPMRVLENRLIVGAVSGDANSNATFLEHLDQDSLILTLIGIGRSYRTTRTLIERA